MKRPGDHALHAYSRLRAPDFAKLVEHLRDSRSAALEQLTRTREMYDVAHLQGELDVMNSLLQYIEEGENLLTNRNR